MSINDSCDSVLLFLQYTCKATCLAQHMNFQAITLIYVTVILIDCNCQPLVYSILSKGGEWCQNRMPILFDKQLRMDSHSCKK